MDYNTIRNAWGADAREVYSTPLDKLPMKRSKDKFRGCIIGGAAGDALGYPIEFLSESFITVKFGKDGLTHYWPVNRPARISDDTQMTLFPANGLLFGTTRGCVRGIRGSYPGYVAIAYREWYKTQIESYKHCNREFATCWRLNVPELFAERAPGNTCMSAADGIFPMGLSGKYGSLRGSTDR